MYIIFVLYAIYNSGCFHTRVVGANICVYLFSSSTAVYSRALSPSAICSFDTKITPHILNEISPHCVCPLANVFDIIYALRLLLLVCNMYYVSFLASFSFLLFATQFSFRHKQRFSGYSNLHRNFRFHFLIVLFIFVL